MRKRVSGLPRNLAAASHVVVQYRLSRLRGGKRALRSVYDLCARLARRPPANWHRADNNFGDQMAPFLLQAATGDAPIWVPGWYPGKILGLGSLIHRVQDGDLVWGTGASENRPVTLGPSARVFAVRGPLTRELLGTEAPEVYGDPGLLLPRYYDRPQEPMYDVGIVPHYLDKPFMHAPPDPAILMIDVQAPWPRVVDNIRKCRAIVSSSLHGLIVAEAYGIPATWSSAGDRVPGGTFKFHDYYLGTHREPPSALRWDGRLPRRLVAPPPPQLDLESLIAAGRRAVEYQAIATKLLTDRS